MLTRENIEEVIKFAYRHDLFIMADEVYQENIVSKPFHSFKKVNCCVIALQNYVLMELYVGGI